MKTAPLFPADNELNIAHIVSEEAQTAIAQQRRLISKLLSTTGFVVAIGSCSVTEDSEAIAINEGRQLADLQKTDPKLAVVQRHCVWKPRTNSQDWHGEETTNPVAAHGLVSRQAGRFGHVAMEIAHNYHISRYGSRVSFAWSGALNAEERDLVLRLAMGDTAIPFCVKNNRKGEIEPVIGIVREINSRRMEVSEHATPAILIWRGGTDFTTPKTWEAQRQRIHELTGGRFIEDPAHGSGIAHDPMNNKTTYGQHSALEHITELFDRGYPSAGVLIEASDIQSRTDPNLPFNVGLRAAQELAKIAINNRGDQS